MNRLIAYTPLFLFRLYGWLRRHDGSSPQRPRHDGSYGWPV